MGAHIDVPSHFPQGDTYFQDRGLCTLYCWNPTYGEFRPNLGLFLVLKRLLKKKTSKSVWNHLWSQVVSSWLNLKPPWNHFGFKKKDLFPKSACTQVFCVSKFSVFSKFRVQIFLKTFGKNVLTGKNVQ